jgi:hypothetical protein
LEEEYRRIHASGVIDYVLCELAKRESRPSPKISKLPKKKGSRGTRQMAAMQHEARSRFHIM